MYDNSKIFLNSFQISTKFWFEAKFGLQPYLTINCIATDSFASIKIRCRPVSFVHLVPIIATIIERKFRRDIKRHSSPRIRYFYHIVESRHVSSCNDITLLIDKVYTF